MENIVGMEICCEGGCVLVVSLVLICEKLIKCLSRHAGTLLMLISGGKSLQCFMQFSVTPANDNNSTTTATTKKRCCVVLTVSFGRQPS